MKKIIMLVFCAVSVCLYPVGKIGIVRFTSVSSGEENIGYLEKSVPEVLSDYLTKRNSSDLYHYDVRLDQAGITLEADSETLERVKNDLHLDLLIVGNVTQGSNGYQIRIKICNLKQKGILYTTQVSTADYDLYPVLYALAEELDGVVADYVAASEKHRLTLAKMVGVEAQIGYPVPVGEYMNIQLGVLHLGGGVDFEYMWNVQKDFAVGIRGNAALRFQFFVNQAGKIEGQFYEFCTGFPVEFPINIDRYYILPGIGFAQYVTAYVQSDYYGNRKVYGAYAPGVMFLANFEVEPFHDRRHHLGAKNEFDVMFYPSTEVGTVKPKGQYVLSFYYLYKPEPSHQSGGKE